MMKRRVKKMMNKNILLGEWAENHPDINPFSGCRNIENLGGAELYWDEFLYRYSEREIFKPANFVAAIQRVFNYNYYKYKSLLATTVATYNMFDNYKVTKEGTETTTFNTTDAHSGSDTRTPTITKTRTDNLSENKTLTPRVEETTTETPTVKTKETFTPTVKTKETVTPTVKTKETDVKGTTMTTTVTPESYTDEHSRTTYDSQVYAPTEKKVHTAGASGSTTVTPSGTGDTKTTEVLSGNTLTENEVVSGNNETVKEVLSGNTTTVKSKTGTDSVAITNTGTSAVAETGTEQMAYNSSKIKTGTEALGFTNRTDSGYMYREPQNAIKDERDIAMFTLIDPILSDIERATLLSIYLY